MNPATSFKCTQGLPPFAWETSVGQLPGKAVLTRLVNHHVKSMAMTIRKISALSGFEIHAVATGTLAGVATHLGGADIERFVGIIATGDTLKP